MLQLINLGYALPAPADSGCQAYWRAMLRPCIKIAGPIRGHLQKRNDFIVCGFLEIVVILAGVVNIGRRERANAIVDNGAQAVKPCGSMLTACTSFVRACFIVSPSCFEVKQVACHVIEFGT